MAVFKPNNFYPYQQEIDMESLDGNVFSCQVNTDGALVSGARLKILSAIDNTELYENVYQFEVENATINGTTTIRTPYRNKEVAEMFVAPYEIFPEYKEDENGNKSWILSDISFQSLCGLNVDYNKKKDMCPYNFYLVKKNKLSLFKIKVKILDTEGKTTYEDIDFYDFSIVSSGNKENLFNVCFNNINFDKYDGLDVNYFIVLKNNYDYLWNVRLYEHYFNEQIDNGTFVSDGYITGTTKNVIWYNNYYSDNDLETYIKKDNYVEIIADENNSDIFEEQITDGKTMSGVLQKTLNPQTVEKQKLHSVNGRIFTDVIDRKIKYVNKYKILDSGQIIKNDEWEETWYTEELIPSNGEEQWLIYPSTPYRNGENKYYQIDSEWVFLNDVVITINSDNNQFQFDFSNSTIGNHVYRLISYDHKFSDKYNSRTEFYDELKRCPFVCSECHTQVIIREVFQDTETEMELYAEYTDSQIVELTLNNSTQKYFIKVLTPAPLHLDYYTLGYVNIGDAKWDFHEYYLKNEYFITADLSANGDIYCFNNLNMFNAFISRSIYVWGNVQSTWSGTDKIGSISSFSFLGNSNILGTKFRFNDGTIKQKIKLKNNSKYKFNAFCYISSVYDDRGNPISVYEINLTVNLYIYSYSDVSYKKEIELVHLKGNKTNGYNQQYIINEDFEILSTEPSDLYGELVVFCDCYYPHNSYITNLQLIENCVDLNPSIFLSEDNVDFLQLINNIYIKFNYSGIVWDNFKYDYLQNNIQKIVKYDRINKTFVLYDKKYQEQLMSFIKDPSFSDEIKEIKYNIIYKQREKIVWHTKSLGLNQNINKIEVENEFPINLKDKTLFYLYSCSDKNTYNSFFGEKDNSLNVDNIYIRFPGYEGKDAMGNVIKDDGLYYISQEDNNIVSGPFINRKYTDKSPLDVYGKEVKSEVFDNHIDEHGNGHYYKLFKVSSYDPNTGEFIIAGGLDRIILNTDRYEVWKKQSIEGSNNEYDITEVIHTYSRIYPQSDKLDEKVQINGSNLLIDDGIELLNSNDSIVFIQPNINLSSDNNHTPFLILDDNQLVLNFDFKYFVDNIKYKIEDTTIEKLDSSQWLLSYSSTETPKLKPGMTYKLYTDWADSNPSSYFYGRHLGEIELKYGELSEVHNIKNSGNFSVLDYDLLREDLYDFDSIIQGDYCVVSGMNIYILANIKNINSKIKKYRYKVYDKNMELIWDSLEIWDNLMEFEIKGLINNEIYYIMFECEDEYGYQYFYESTFYSDYSIQNIPNDYVKITSLCSQNAVKLEIDPVYFSLSDYNLQNIDEINVYRKDSIGHVEWINSINLNSDKVYTGPKEIDYKYGFIDYRVRNNEYYDYLFVFDKKKYSLSNFEKYQYVLTMDSFKTNFDSWSMVDIIKNQDTGIYEVSGDLWSFRYNLETSEITNNTSVTSWDTLGKYAQMGGGERGYDSSSLTCLLGDVGEYISFDGKNNVLKYGYHEKMPTSLIDEEFKYNNGRTNNIEKYKKWKRYCRNNNLKLLKDMSGNMWIVGIAENPSTNINNNSVEQLKTISFQWKEVMDITGISILGKLSSYDRKDFLLSTISSILNPYWDLYDINDDYTEYKLKIIKNNLSMDQFVITGSVITDIVNSQGVLVTKDENDVSVSPFYNNGYQEIKEYIFDDAIKFTHNSIDDLFKNNDKIQSVKITLDNRINSAKNAFSGCVNLTTDNGGYIKINSSDYINTLGILDNTVQNITIEWDSLLTNKTANLLTYIELYEQYWNYDNITLLCPQLEFRINDWQHTIVQESGIDTDDLITYDKIVYLNKYNGSDEQIFIPKYYKEKINDQIIVYKVIIDDNFSIE